MARKFYTSYHALVGNYGSNQNVVRFSYIGGVWVESELIIVPPSSANLLSMSIGAATVGNARCLKTVYQSDQVAPITSVGGVWSGGTAVSLAGGGSPSHLAQSFDGMHALIACDNSNVVNAVKFNMSTGLWEPNGYTTVPESNLTNVAITPDGLRGIVVPKTSSNAYPLTRNPITNVWSSGSAIALGSGNTRYFSCSMSPDGNVCLVGSNAATNSDALFWNGSTWTRASVPLKLAVSKWFTDGRSIIATSNNDGDNATYFLDYDPDTQAITLNQQIDHPGYTSIVGPALPELGRQDIAIVLAFGQNRLIPLTNVGGTWAAGTPVASPNFNNPISSVIVPAI